MLDAINTLNSKSPVSVIYDPPTVAMTRSSGNQNKDVKKVQNENNSFKPTRKSIRTRKQIVFENGERKIVTCKNNNAQLVSKQLDLGKGVNVQNHKARNDKMRKDKLRCNTEHASCKRDTIKSNAPNMPFFDGIQVSVSSDEEELDYEDFVDMGNDDDDGSINQESGQPVNKPEQEVNRDSSGSDIQLGATSTSMTEEDMIMNNLHLKKLFNKMLDECIQNAKSLGETSSSKLLTKATPEGQSGKQIPGSKMTTPVNNNTVNLQGGHFVKSPSDTTIYVPTLKCSSQKDVVNLNQQFGADSFENINEKDKNSGATNADNSICNQLMPTKVIKKISDFVDQLRIKHIEEAEVEMPEQQMPRSMVTAPEYEEAQGHTDEVIIQAEKFRASVEKPPGNEFFTQLIDIDSQKEQVDLACNRQVIT